MGDQPLWAEPPDAVRKLVPNYPLMWGMFGVAQPPSEGAGLRGLADGGTLAWQYVEGADTIEIISGINEGDRFITTGATAVRNNDVLIIAGQPAQGGPGGGMPKGGMQKGARGGQGGRGGAGGARKGPAANQ